MDYTGEIVPCCWVGASLHRWRTKDAYFKSSYPVEDDGLIEEVLDGSHNAIKYGATKVMENQWFTKLKESFGLTNHVEYVIVSAQKIKFKKERLERIWG